jgi:hypothetical protein
MKIVEKEKAIHLRRQGKSINQIVLETGSSKASVSVWVRNIKLTPAQLRKLSLKGRSVASIEKRRLSRLVNEQKKKRLIIDEAKRDFQRISLSELKLIGIILYLGEGTKSNKGMVVITNSDPEVIKIAAKFLREVCHVPESKFRGHIHTFLDADIRKTEEYWSKVSGIPTSQFYKTYVKPSSASLQKKKTLQFGTFSISTNDTKLFLKIIGWIEKIKELLVK